MIRFHQLDFESSMMSSSKEATEAPSPSRRLDAARERLQSAQLLMRYDYAWKEKEFAVASESPRMRGVVCRLLYLYEAWQHAADERRGRIQLLEPAPSSMSSSSSPSSSTCQPSRRVWIGDNGYPAFREHVAAACELMGFEVLPPATTAADDDARRHADLVFLYVPPPGEEQDTASPCGDAYSTMAAITAHHDKQATDVEHRPVFCLLLGETELLPPPASAETERLRGLSGFAISQRLQPVLERAAYTSVGHFAVEFTPPPAAPRHHHAGQGQLSELMNQFGCMDHNLMHHTEKWELYAPTESIMGRDADVVQPSEAEARYWLEQAKGRSCDHCHEMQAKLSRCSRCGHAVYCSRACQKADWKIHKRLCGMAADEIA